MADQKIFTLSQVAQQNSKNACWLIIDGRVLDVTKFLEEHPGGEEILIESAGKDATKAFKDIGHSKAAQNMLKCYQIGVLQSNTTKDSDNTIDGSVDATRKNEMSAYVIKDDSKRKYAAFVEFFFPLFVAVTFFAYRYVTGAAQMKS